MNWFLIVNDEDCREELRNFLKRHAESIMYKTDMKKGLKNIDRALKGMTRSTDDLLIINSSSNIHLVRISDIMHCQSTQNYTQLRLANGKKCTASKTLKQFELHLKKHGFARVHQSHLVNISYIDRYVKGIGGHLVLTDGTQVPVAARKKELLMNELEKL